MIIQLGGTLIILQVVHRHVQKKFIHIPCFTATESRELIIIVREYSEFIWQRSWLPAQLFSIGGEVVELNGPRKLHEHVGPGDEFLWGEYNHDVSFLTNSAMSCPPLGSSVVNIRMPWLRRDSKKRPIRNHPGGGWFADRSLRASCQARSRWRPRDGRSSSSVPTLRSSSGISSR